MGWNWLLRNNKHGKPYCEGMGDELDCMIQLSTFKIGVTSTTFWKHGERRSGDFYLKHEQFRSIPEAQAWIEGQTTEALLAASRPRAEQHKSYATKPSKPPPPDISKFMAEYEARRCKVCGEKYPPFGFPNNVWTCFRHRKDIDREPVPDSLFE
jgi:hypothetical protein